MPLIVAAFLGGLATVMGSLVGRVLLALGMTYVTYKGVDVTADWLINYIKNSFSGLSGELVGFLAWCWVDKALSLVFSTWTACLAIRLIGGSGITKLVLKK